jgi:hypothetical protein
MGIHSLPARHWGRIGLVALLGLTLALVTVSAGHATARSAGHAVVAKKKCKKKKHRSASSAKKKKKCKKVHHVVLPAPAPLVRATLSWSAQDEVDLHAYDPSGNHAGWDFNANPPFGGVVNNIPSGRHSGDAGPGGPSETFTDDIYVVGGPSTREFSSIACLYSGPDEPNDYTATFTGVAKDGTVTTLNLNGTPSDGSDIYVLSVPGGPATPDPVTACGLVM